MDISDGKQYSYDYNERKALEFMKDLSEIGISISKNSDLYRIGFYVLDVYDKHKNPGFEADDNEDMRPRMRDVLGFNNFIEKVSPLLKSKYLDQVIPHLRLLSSSSIPQNTKSKITDHGSNKLFELYIASLCYPKFENIMIDSPEDSKGDNPDVMFDHNGTKWGIACKVLHSFKALTILDNVIKAIDQIEKSESDTGIVMLNLKNIIDHDEIWPIVNRNEYEEGKANEYGTFVSVDTPVQMLYAYVEKMQNILIEEIGVPELLRIFEKKKAQPIIAIIIQGTTGLVHQNLPTFSFLGFTGLIRIREISENVIEILDHFNERLR